MMSDEDMKIAPYSASEPCRIFNLTSAERSAYEDIIDCDTLLSSGVKLKRFERLGVVLYLPAYADLDIRMKLGSMSRCCGMDYSLSFRVSPEGETPITISIPDYQPCYVYAFIKRRRNHSRLELLSDLPPKNMGCEKKNARSAKDFLKFTPEELKLVKGIRSCEGLMKCGLPLKKYEQNGILVYLPKYVNYFWMKPMPVAENGFYVNFHIELESEHVSVLIIGYQPGVMQDFMDKNRDRLAVE